MYESTMRTIEEITEEKYGQAIRLILDSGIPIQKEEAFWIATKMKELMLEALIEMSTAIPRISEDPNRLHCYNGKSVIGRHKLNGRLVHIAQIFSENGIKYYTEGKREE